MLAAFALSFSCTVLGTLSLWLCLRSRVVNIPTSLIISIGFAIGVSLVTATAKLLANMGITLEHTGLLVLNAGLLTLSAGLWRMRHYDFVSTLTQIRRGFASSKLSLVCFILMLGHVAGTLTNNLMRPIFPWDAFTTWMYRSKAWVADNQITPLSYTPEWLAAGAHEGFAIYANTYPDSLSILAALASAIAGDWNPVAASTLWTFSGIAVAMGLFGLCRWANFSFEAAMLAAFLTLSLPLLTIHLALAGYGDIWMALYSGLGLALLVFGISNSNTSALFIALILLMMGTQIKTEGWVWLGIGGVFLGIQWALQRKTVKPMLVTASLLTVLLWSLGITTLDLGPMGLWGLTDRDIMAGPLGAIALRPYNPTADYIQALFLSNNFSLLFPLLLAGLVSLVLFRRREFLCHGTMILLIGASQVIIFGLSSHSQYAEIGTAITRLALHFIPVFIFTAVAGLVHLQNKYYVAESIVKHRRSLIFIPVLITLTSLSLSAGLVVLSSYRDADATPLELLAKDFTSVVGSGVLDPVSGWQFHASNQPFGVLASTIAPPEKARYLWFESTGAGASSVVFYWVTRDQGSLYRVRLPNEGPALIDLKTHKNWDPAQVQEMGLVVPDTSFSNFQFKAVTLASALHSTALPGLFARWWEKPEISQRSINDLSVDYAGPSTFVWMSLALLILVAAWLLPIPNKHWKRSVFSGFLIILLFADVVWLQAFLRDSSGSLLVDGTGSSNDRGPEKTFTQIAKSLKQTLPTDQPAIVIPATPSDRFFAERLPFTLLPIASGYISPRIRQVPADWSGSIIFVGGSDKQLRQKLKTLGKRLKREITILHAENGLRVVQ